MWSAKCWPKLPKRKSIAFLQKQTNKKARFQFKKAGFCFELPYCLYDCSDNNALLNVSLGRIAAAAFLIQGM